MSYVLRVKVIGVANEPGDVVVNLTCHLTDSAGFPFQDPDTAALDEFQVRAPKSSIPATGVLAYLTDLTEQAIADKYDANFLAEGENGSATITMDTTDLNKVILDMLCEGPGLAAPTDTVSRTSGTRLLLGDPLVLDYTADTESKDIELTGDVTLDDNTLTNISETSRIEDGMFVSGTGIPSFSTVVSVISSNQSVVISQNAVASATGAVITFNDDPESKYLKNVSPPILSDRYIGMAVEGDGLPDDTTIVGVVSSDQAELSVLATGSFAGSTYQVTGGASYFFDTSGLTVDYDDLQRVVDTINFDEL